jgi:hypothetical protein
VFVRAAGGGRRQVSTNGGLEPPWAANGRELFYREPVGGSLVVATYRTDPTFTVESRAPLFDATPFALVNGWRGYDVTSDGQRFVMMRQDQDSDAPSGRLVPCRTGSRSFASAPAAADAGRAIVVRSSTAESRGGRPGSRGAA